MTGYGRGEKGGFIAEVRSLNHRFFDISVRLPKTLSPLETKIKKEFQSKFSRGKFEVSITRTGEMEARSLVIDSELAQQYYKLLEGLKRDLNLKGEVDLALMASMNQLITLTEKDEDIEIAWNDIEGALQNSIAELIRMRRDEGEFLRGDLLIRVDSVERHLNTIDARCPQVIQDHRERLSERVKSLFGEIEMDERRLHLEVVLFAERCDIAEELVRVRSHMRQFRNTIEAEGAVGKKLDFLLQEIGREVNTISSKASDAEISQEVVEIKGELERIREQVQNIE